MSTHLISTTPEQDAAIHDLGRTIQQATQPGGSGSPLHIYEADDYLMTLFTIFPDGRWTQEQRGFHAFDGWDEVATSESVKEG